MKNLIISVFLIFAFNSQAQSWAAKLENAQFQVRVNNYTAHTSEVKATQGTFSDNEFDLISNRCLSKEGIFKLDLSPEKTTITVYYLNWIDEFTINWLFTEAVPDINRKMKILPKEDYTF